MKQFLNGVAIAAALAVTAPALAQAPTSGAPAEGAVAAPAAGHATGHARMHRAQRPTHARRAASGRVASIGRSAGTSPSDNVANQLNQQELQRVGAGPAPAARAVPRAAPSAAQPGLSTSSGTYIPPTQPGPVSSSSASSMGPKDSGGGYIPAPTGPMPMPPPPPISSPVR